MSTVYQEGPFRNWTSVNWPDEEFYVAVWFDGSPLDSLGVIRPFPPGRMVSSGAALSGVIRGVDSGAVLDIRSVPFDVGTFSVIDNPAPPPCSVSVANVFDLSGNAITSAPFMGYNVVGGPADSKITVIGKTSKTWNGFFCGSDNNGPAMPAAFIVGEKVTIKSQ